MNYLDRMLNKFSATPEWQEGECRDLERLDKENKKAHEEQVEKFHLFREED